jgi:hypothetical protein
MKKSFWALALVGAILLTFQTGCDKVSNVLNSYIRCSIDGRSFYATFATGTVVSGKLTILGAQSNGAESISLIIPDTIGAGVRPLSSIGLYTAQYKAAGVGVPSLSTSGYVNIESNDRTLKTLKGSFIFDVTSVSGVTSHVTGGSFSASYF